MQFLDAFSLLTRVDLFEIPCKVTASLKHYNLQNNSHSFETVI